MTNNLTIERLTPLLKHSPPWLMGVLNLTPDSFSDGGKHLAQESAISHGEYLLNSGADILDIGGESTGPGRTRISSEEELLRIGSTVRYFSSRCLVSVDTYKAKTAEAALTLGARMINDVSALRADLELASVVRDFEAYVVLMYSKEDDRQPHATLTEKTYDCVIEQIGSFLSRRIDFALSCGISTERIILDPGMGAFISTDADYSWKVLQHFAELTAKFPEFPWLIGTSRKSFLGGAIVARDPLSQLTALNAWQKGASFIRTHNVEMAKQFVDAWKVMEE